MNIKIKNRNGCIHLYDPQKEGIGLYDMHYINASKKKKIKNIFYFYDRNSNNEKHAA